MMMAALLTLLLRCARDLPSLRHLRHPRVGHDCWDGRVMRVNNRTKDRVCRTANWPIARIGLAKRGRSLASMSTAKAFASFRILPGLDRHHVESNYVQAENGFYLLVLTACTSRRRVLRHSLARRSKRGKLCDNNNALSEVPLGL